MPHSNKRNIFFENEWYAKKRNKSILISPEKHLILCEGTKTEPNYFQEIKERINNKYRDKINIDVCPSGKGRLDLLNQAKQKVENSKVNYNHVWLVYDKDDFNKDEFDNTVYKIQAINKESDTQYHALWSNQCVEVWFLLHFIDLKVDVNREEYIKKINENWKRIGIQGQYTKNDCQIYNKLEKYQDMAVKRAQKIIFENEGKAPSQIAPASMIYELIEMLGIYLKK